MAYDVRRQRSFLGSLMRTEHLVARRLENLFQSLPVPDSLQVSRFPSLPPAKTKRFDSSLLLPAAHPFDRPSLPLTPMFLLIPLYSLELSTSLTVTLVLITSQDHTLSAIPPLPDANDSACEGDNGQQERRCSR
eukprot:750490-Pleurochrysis_carterae.AAC.1